MLWVKPIVQDRLPVLGLGKGGQDGIHSDEANGIPATPAGLLLLLLLDG